MKNNWHRIFKSKNFFYYTKSNLNKFNNSNNIPYSLCKIIHPEMSLKKFNSIVKFISKNLRLKQKDSLLDFGSGNGSLLFFFIKKYNLRNNFSLEISPHLLQLQKKFIKKTKFFKTHQINTKLFNNFDSCSVDNSICISVFQYFNNIRYFYDVLEFLIKVTKKNILIYDIKNSKTKKKYREQVRKRQKLTSSEFNKKYKNTPIRYYDKLFIKKYLFQLQKKYDFTFKFKKLPNTATDHKFGYCLIINKNKYIKF